MCERIKRIEIMELYFDSLKRAAEIDRNLPTKDAALRRMLSALFEYYGSGQWLSDYEADERGEIPASLKRGVLSQDGLHNLFSALPHMMSSDLKKDAQCIMDAALTDAMPDTAVKKALENVTFSDGKIILIAVGKAAWTMAHAAHTQLKERISSAVVITKYEHSKGAIADFSIYEAGHPVPDKNSFLATQAALDAVGNLTEEDTVLFLLSGGGSALFEFPLIPENDLRILNEELLACGADIKEINTLRKRFSAVKGGRFAQLCYPARVCSIVLSDVLGDPLDVIASGPAYPDSSTCEEALLIAEKYQLTLSEQMKNLLHNETAKQLNHVESQICGSVRQLCKTAESVCQDLGYETFILSDCLSCTARDAGVFLGNVAQYHGARGKKTAFICGGETVVRLTGNGMGGRNQELALAAAPYLDGLKACLFSIGSDGTDGPTDAAGGYVDGNSFRLLEEKGISIYETLQKNDSYHALQQCGGLIITGPSGTNVNDLTVLLIQP